MPQSEHPKPMSRIARFSAVAAFVILYGCDGGIRPANPSSSSGTASLDGAGTDSYRNPGPGHQQPDAQIHRRTLHCRARCNRRLIDHVQIGPCAAHGIVVTGARIRITNNVIHTEHGGESGVDTGDGVYIGDSTDVLLQGNQFSNNESSIIAVASPNTSIIGNYSLNPIGPFPRGQHFGLTHSSDGSQITDNFGDRIHDSEARPTIARVHRGGNQCLSNERCPDRSQLPAGR